MNIQLPLFKKSLPEVFIPSFVHDSPKIDLHRHLLGSISAEMLSCISKEIPLSLPNCSFEELENLLTIKEPVNGLRPYFRPWSILSKLLITPDIVSSLVYYVLRDAKKDNIIYTEIRVSWGMTGKEPFSIKEFLRGVQDGLARGQQEFGVIGRVVFGITRHLFGRHVSWQRRRLWSNILEAVGSYKNSVVVGFDLSGIEEGYPPHFFLEEFRQVKEMGFPFTIHCGETVGAKDIWETIDVLQPSRISHALSSVSDKTLLEHLSILQMPIEVCPTSNWLTRAVTDLSKHPIKEMHDYGLKLTINTDNPAICRTTLSREYALIISNVGLSGSLVEQFLKNSIESMFGDHPLRYTILQEFTHSKRGVL